MELGVEEFIEGLLTKTALETPSDTTKPEDAGMRLPEWFDEKQFNRGRKFYWHNCYSFSTSMLLGLVAVFAIPSILRVLVGSRRSTSVYTAYKRYLSTLLHTVSWFENELKPGSISWRSLMAVRSRHFRAGAAAQLKGQGIVSQRDMALTQFGFIGFSVLKPDQFGIRQLSEGDWEAYNHFWRVIGHAIGLEDRYNICRKNIDETREVCQILLDRVYTPCLDNVPEYFEHMARSMLDGQWAINPTIHVEGILYWTKYLANVPGYFFTESERIDLQKRIKQQLKGKSSDIGVDSSTLISKCAIEGLPTGSPKLLYLRDYDTIESSPAYKRLEKAGKNKLSFYSIYAIVYSTWLGRWYFNLNFKFSLLLMKYLPYLAFFRHGVIASYVNIFTEDPVDDTEPKPNAEYYKTKQPMPWYKELLSLFW
ncbi:uncharacterized protein [Epargyreus clarus]|uniref:uncharacterized protein n=1 Tax=Epargyreus clarus TaxID=520877 RepID=UPI003C30A39A